MGAVIDNYLTVQQDLLETFVDRGQLRQLSEPTGLPHGKRIPRLKIDNPRPLAVMHALVRFANLAAGSQFSTRDLHRHVAEALGVKIVHTPSALSATIYPSSEPGTLSKRSNVLGAIVSPGRAIRFAWFS